MHILIVVLHRPTQPTGVCRHAANLAQALAGEAKVEQVTLVTGAWQRQSFASAFSLQSDKIKLIDIDFKNSAVARNLWFLFGLPKLVKQLRPDLVHLAFPLPFWRSQFSCPVVATIHDLYPYECPENFGHVQAVLNRLFLRQCVAQSDGLTCVSEVTLKQLQHFFPDACARKPVTVNYNYVDFSQITPQMPAAKLEQPFLLSIAQHRRNKNLHLLIQAHATLLKSGQLPAATTLVLVGSSGPETAALQQQIADLQTPVLLLSSLSDSELCWLYQHCQLYVVCSSTEGFCLPLAEALYLGCQAVCSDIPILREVAQSDCTYFSLEGDPAQNLAEAIIRWLQQPAQLSRQTKRFSKSAIAEQYIGFYLKVMAQLPNA